MSTSNTWKSLQEVLQARAADSEAVGNSGLLLYSLGNTKYPRDVSYHTLHHRAKETSVILQNLKAFKKNKPFVLHFDDHWDTILWFWAVLLAEGLPVLSSPFSNVEEHRRKHIRGLSSLLESPICVTRSKLLHLFGDEHGMQLYTVEVLENGAQTLPSVPVKKDNSDDDRKTEFSGDTKDKVAMLMLTSGSTGNSKAVELSHSQILSSVAGKSSVRQLPSDRPFLNWIGLDHVGALVEIHLHALWHGVSQVHVNAVDIISSPTSFLDLLSRHRVSRTFAPNFFLARLVSGLRALGDTQRTLPPRWDLSNLVFLVSGGEANDTKTCVDLSTLLQPYGSPCNVIAPGFGMTETCAGCIYNIECPHYDMANNRTVASLGKCVEGIKMRIISNGTTAESANTGVAGELQVSGPIVFSGYYRNPGATSKAFTPDGWFRTGDQATIDINGRLSVIGRTDDVININGIKIIAADVQTLLEQVLASRVSRLIVFGTRAAHTEQITICYVPVCCPVSARDMIEIENIAFKACMSIAAVQPFIFYLREQSLALLPTSALGKISRSKMRSLFQEHKFDEETESYQQTLRHIKKRLNESFKERMATKNVETTLVENFAEILGLSPEDVGLNTSLFDLGFSSMNFVQLKHHIDARYATDIPLVTILNAPTAISLASILDPKSKATQSLGYDPVVTFRSEGNKTPLWLIHPGVGEVLVFVALAKHMEADRPLYAMRAPGFEKDQNCFTSIEEAVESYATAIRSRQPQGPYAIAGYSYGGMLAFEIAKKLNTGIKAQIQPVQDLAASTEPPRKRIKLSIMDNPKAEVNTEDAVRFLGILNLPPNIKWRMRQLNWHMCLLNLVYFLGLSDEDRVENIDQDAFQELSAEESLNEVLDNADIIRLKELGLEKAHLNRWSNVAYSLQSMAVDYEPTDKVDAIDVFHCEPLKAAAPSSEVWVKDHLSKWKKYSRTTPIYHAVCGAHYTMLNSEHVVGFAVQLKSALQSRGL